MQILSIISPTKKKCSEIMCVPQLWAVVAGWFCAWVKLPNVFRTDLARFL